MLSYIYNAFQWPNPTLSLHLVHLCYTHYTLLCFFHYICLHFGTFPTLFVCFLWQNPTLLLCFYYALLPDTNHMFMHVSAHITKIPAVNKLKIITRTKHIMWAGPTKHVYYMFTMFSKWILLIDFCHSYCQALQDIDYYFSTISHSF